MSSVLEPENVAAMVQIQQNTTTEISSERAMLDLSECEAYRDDPRAYAFCRGERSTPEGCNLWLKNHGLPHRFPVNATAPPEDHATKRTVRVWAGKGAGAAAAKAMNLTAPPPTAHATGQVVPRKGCCGGAAAKVSDLNGHGPGSRLWQHYEAAGMPHCDACLKLAIQMDRWGIETTRAKLDEIVAAILPRAQTWMKQNHPWFHAWLPTAIETAGLTAAIRAAVERAINSAS